MEQLDFSFSVPPATRRMLIDPRRSPGIRAQWAKRFAETFHRPFRVVFRDRTSTMVSTRVREGVLELSLHPMFIAAPEAVLEALACFIQGRRSEPLDRFIARHRDLVGRARVTGTSRGKVYDLSRIRDALCRAYLHRSIQVPVCWGRGLRRPGARSVRLGSYSFEDRLIRIHPALDRPFVPAFVVVAVVYHELLHHLLGDRGEGGRRRLHTAEFRRLEEKYVHHARAERWTKDHLNELLRSNRRGTDPR